MTKGTSSHSARRTTSAACGPGTSGTPATDKRSGSIYVNVDQSDPEAVAMVRAIFPDAEIRGITLVQRLAHYLALLLHGAGKHADVWTYRLGLDASGKVTEHREVTSVDVEAAVLGESDYDAVYTVRMRADGTGALDMSRSSP